MQFIVEPNDDFSTAAVVRALKATYPGMGVRYTGGESESVVTVRFMDGSGVRQDTTRPDSEMPAIRTAIETQSTIIREV
jgi:hypothetical protein